MTNLCEMRDRRKLINTLSLLEAQTSLLQKLSATKEPVPFDFSKFCEFVKQHYPEYYDNVITLVWRRVKECSNSFSSNALKNNPLESIVLSSDEDASCTIVVSDDDSDCNRNYSHNVSSPVSKFKFSQFTELESKYSIINIEHDGSDNDTIESKNNSQLSKEFDQRLSKKKKSSKEDIRNNQLLKKNSQNEVNKRKNKSVEDKKTLTLTSKTKMRETKYRKYKRIKEDKFQIDNTDQKTAKKKRSAKSDLIYKANCDEGKKKMIKIIKEKNINKKEKKCHKKILTQMEIETLRNQLLLDKLIEMNLMQ